VFGEFLYLHPTGVDMAHAQQQNGLGGAGTVPFGRVGTVDPHHEPGVRFGFTYALDCCSSFRTFATWLQTDAVDRVVPPGIPSGAVGSLVHHPGAALTASVGPVDAAYDFELRMVEVNYRRLWCASDQGWLNYFVGAKYGQLEQEFQQTGVFGGGLGGAIDTTSEIDFDGGGLTMGLDFEVLWRHGFSLYGRGSVSAMVGEFRSDYSMFNSTAAIQLALAQWEDDRFVSMLEYELGLAWVDKCEHVRISAGYTAMFWFNAVTTPSFIDAVQADNYTDVSGTIAFDGLVGRIEFMW
jgi:hypothetical protein